MVTELLMALALFQGSTAKVHVVNNTVLSLPVAAVAPQLDTAVKYLGTVSKCSERVFKLPAVPGVATVIIVADAQQVFDLYKQQNLVMEFQAVDTAMNCKELRKVVFEYVEFVPPDLWRQRGFAKIGEVEAPVQLVVAGDNTVCPLWQIPVSPIPKRGESWICKEQWRQARP